MSVRNDETTALENIENTDDLSVTTLRWCDEVDISSPCTIEKQQKLLDFDVSFEIKSSCCPDIFYKASHCRDRSRRQRNYRNSLRRNYCKRCRSH